MGKRGCIAINQALLFSEQQSKWIVNTKKKVKHFECGSSSKYVCIYFYLLFRWFACHCWFNHFFFIQTLLSCLIWKCMWVYRYAPEQTADQAIVPVQMFVFCVWNKGRERDKEKDSWLSTCAYDDLWPNLNAIFQHPLILFSFTQDYIYILYKLFCCNAHGKIVKRKKIENN